MKAEIINECVLFPFFFYFRNERVHERGWWTH